MRYERGIGSVMENYEPIPLISPNIPDKILTVANNLKYFIIVKDGHIVKRQLEGLLNTITIDTYDRVLPEQIDLFFDSEFVNDFFPQDNTYLYNIKNVNCGLFIHVPKNTVIKDTIHLFYIQSNHEMVANIRIIVDENSEFDVFEYLYNENEATIHFVSNSIVKENAKLSFSGISSFSKTTKTTIMRNSFVNAYARSNYSIAEINDGDTDSQTNMFLLGPSAEATTKTVAFTTGTQIMKIKQWVEHKAPRTKGIIENYGVSNNKSKLVFEGIGKINKNMKKSIAQQTNRGIVLGNESILQANPLLLIDEYDVEAGHGAAIGKIDEEQLYYLMSRGLPLRMAEKLIINGFLSPILEVLNSDVMKEQFIKSVERKTI
jgi:Fe-S cluster assembly protein SufD